MVDLATRITNLTTASVLLFQFGIGFEEVGGRHKVRAWIRDSVDNTALRERMKERPGLQNITYKALFDKDDQEKLVSSLLKMALSQKDANVNIMVNFLNSLTTIDPLIPGQIPPPLMIDNRIPKQFKSIIDNKDRKALKFDIFQNAPV